jgi:lysozyme
LDSSFAADYAGIKAAGMIRGAYQFFEPNEDPVAQAHTLLAAIGPLGPGDLPPALVVEVSDGESPAAIANAIRSWVNTVEGATGEIPIIYSSSSFWDGFVGSTNFSNDPLWDAAWDVALPTHLATGWPAGDWQFWQYLDSGDVSGIGGAVDLDRFNGTIGQLDSLAHAGDARVHDDSSVAALLFGAMAGIVVLRLAYGRSPLMPLG